MKRIINHWTAGTHKVSSIDRKHYHIIVDGDGDEHEGDNPIDANSAFISGKYAAHTLNCNTDSIGVAVAAMHNAVERPFNAGRYPITQKQLTALVKVNARLCKQYGIPVSRETVLSHAEVEPTLGIKQRGKWDIAWLPGMAAPGDPVAVGDKFRAMVSAALQPDAPPAPPAQEIPRQTFWQALSAILIQLGVKR